jgi:hypothetical protein
VPVRSCEGREGLIIAGELVARPAERKQQVRARDVIQGDIGRRCLELAEQGVVRGRRRPQVGQACERLAAQGLAPIAAQRAWLRGQEPIIGGEGLLALASFFLQVAEIQQRGEIFRVDPERRAAAPTRPPRPGAGDRHRSPRD